MDMKVAVTGGRGLVGRFVVDELLRAGHELRVLTRTPWPECPAEAEVVPNVDIRDFDALLPAFAGCEGVVHIANIPGPLDEDRPETFVNNVTGNYNVMLAAGLTGVRRLVVAGSTCAGGFCRNHHYPCPDYLPLDEQHPCRPDDTYGISKYLSEILAERMVQRFPFMSIALLRITMVVEPPMYRVMNLPQYLDEERLWAHNMATYVDARDSAVAFRLALEADLQGAEVFYICNPDSFSNLDTRQMLAKYFPNSPLRAPVGPRDAAESSAKAARVLGWTPKHNWRDEVAASAPRTEKFGELPSDNWFI